MQVKQYTGPIQEDRPYKNGVIKGNGIAVRTHGFSMSIWGMHHDAARRLKAVVERRINCNFDRPVVY